MRSNFSLAYLIVGGMEVLVKSIDFADQVARKLPVVSRIRDAALDTFLGPCDVDDPHPITTRK
jgi:hypothetical protein